MKSQQNSYQIHPPFWYKPSSAHSPPLHHPPSPTRPSHPSSTSLYICYPNQSPSTGNSTSCPKPTETAQSSEPCLLFRKGTQTEADATLLQATLTGAMKAWSGRPLPYAWTPEWTCLPERTWKRSCWVNKATYLLSSLTKGSPSPPLGLILDVFNT